VTPRLSHILLGAACAVGLVGLIAWGSGKFAQHTETKAEIQEHIDEGKATTHADAAAKIPDHAAPLQGAEDAVARARAKVARTGDHLAPQPGPSVPDHTGAGQTVPDAMGADPGVQGLRDALAAERELSAAQDAQIGALKAAYADEQRRSAEYKAAFEAERRRATGLEIALAAQKHVSGADKWLGRVQGFAVGIGAGYVAGRVK